MQTLHTAYAADNHSQQMACNRRYHPGEYHRAVHSMVLGQVHMWWYRGLLLRVLRLLFLTK